jgi:uncharacterized repeat protein (TIGR01451 family)
MPKRLRRRLRKSVWRSLAVAFALVAGATASTASAHPSRDVAVALHGADRARQGDYPVYVATIRNAGHDPVTGIAVSFALPAGWTIRAVAASQGRCEPARTTCAVGSLAGDEAATVTLVLWAGSAGRASVAASLSVGGDENASNDSAAHATVVTPSRCRMRVSGGPVRAGLPASVGVAVRLGANPVRGRRVVARGAGMSSSARTNARGVARLRVRSETPGALAISVPGLAGCRTRVQVTPAQ